MDPKDIIWRGVPMTCDSSEALKFVRENFKVARNHLFEDLAMQKLPEGEIEVCISYEITKKVRK